MFKNYSFKVALGLLLLIPFVSITAQDRFAKVEIKTEKFDKIELEIERNKSHLPFNLVIN